MEESIIRQPYPKADIAFVEYSLRNRVGRWRTLTSFDGTRVHRNNRNEESGQDVEDRKDEIYFDRPQQIRLAPPKPRKAQHGDAYAELQIELNSSKIEIESVDRIYMNLRDPKNL